ncbi:MAG TPA: hypothetical protein VGK38_05150, partial [Prolixibacteraceae bacterium]
KNNHSYYITFQDTLLLNPKGDTLKTKNYSLIDSTDNKPLVVQNPNLELTSEQPIIDGFQLLFHNAPIVEVDTTRSAWNVTGLPKFVFEKFVDVGKSGELRPNDYTITFGSEPQDTSVTFKYQGDTYPGQPVNFKVFNSSTKKYLKFGFLDFEKSEGPGIFSSKGTKRDRIVFLEPNSKDSLVVTWWFYLAKLPDSVLTVIQSGGDMATIILKKPFLAGDVFNFKTTTQFVDKNLEKVQLDNIKVVPNPYLASAQWENKNPYSSGRGTRSLHFTHLPSVCTVRIFSVDGSLVKTIYHNSPIDDGSEDWDMLSKDNLSISYGVYIAYIEAPGVGNKIVKFAVIK